MSDKTKKPKEIWRIHYKKDYRVIELSSLSFTITEAPNGEKTYFFQSPSKKKADVVRVNVFLYKDSTHLEWLKEGKLIDSLTLKSKSLLTYEEGLLKVTCMVTKQ